MSHHIIIKVFYHAAKVIPWWERVKKRRMRVPPSFSPSLPSFNTFLHVPAPKMLTLASLQGLSHGHYYQQNYTIGVVLCNSIHLTLVAICLCFHLFYQFPLLSNSIIHLLSKSTQGLMRCPMYTQTYTNTYRIPPLGWTSCKFVGSTAVWEIPKSNAHPGGKVYLAFQGSDQGMDDTKRKLVHVLILGWDWWLCFNQ